MAHTPHNGYAAHSNGRYLATSFALHMILFSAITFLVVEEEIITAKPLPMSVSVMLVEATEHCPVMAKREPEAIQQKTPPHVTKHSDPLPVVKRVIPTPVAEPIKAVETVSKSEPAVSTPSPVPVQTEARLSEMPKAPAAPKVVEAPLTAAIFNAAYLNNPKPNYPKISKRLGEEGTVILKVRVLANGTAGSVTILKSSEFDRLDQSALEAVKQWKFVAAKQGDKVIDSWVSVPVAFKLDS